MAKNYNFFKKDDNHVAIQSGTGIATKDAHATPKTSPLAVSSTEIVITVPTNAAEVVFGVDQDMQVSEVTGMANYFIQKSGTVENYGVSNTDTLYVKRNSADVSLNFKFILV